MIGIYEFFESMTGFTPTVDQRLLLDSILDPSIKKILASAGRQSGKTLTCAVAALYFVFEWPTPVKILLTSGQDSILYYHMREIFKRHPEFDKEILSRGTFSLVPLHGFETKNGSIVHVRGSTDKQIRGVPADFVFIDEPCLIKNDIILTSLGNLSGNISKFIMLGTPNDNKSLFVEWSSDPKSGFKVHNWSSEALPWHDKVIDATKKKEYTFEKYKVEMLGIAPTKAERMFFSSKHINECCKPFVEKEGGPQSQIEIGIDWGFESGTTLAVIERLGPRVKILYTQQWLKKAIDIIAPEIAGVINKWQPVIVKADSKPEDYQHHVEKYTSYRLEYVRAWEYKEMILAQLHRVVEKNLLEIPEEKLNIIIQFRKYKRNARRGDDYVDAIALANYKPELPFRPEGRVFVGNSNKIRGEKEYGNEREREIRY